MKTLLTAAEKDPPTKRHAHAGAPMTALQAHQSRIPIDVSGWLALRERLDADDEIMKDALRRVTRPASTDMPSTQRPR
jgi:hypothetical protein